MTNEPTIIYVDQAYRALDRIQIKNAPWLMALTIDKGEKPETWVLGVRIETTDRDVGDLLNLTFYFPFTLPMTERGLMTLYESSVRHVFLHEFAECFHVDGVRVNDPHVGQLIGHT